MHGTLHLVSRVRLVRAERGADPVLFVWVLQKQLRCRSSSSFPLIEIKNPPTLRNKGDDSLLRSVGGFLISINSIALELRQRCRHEKSPY